MHDTGCQFLGWGRGFLAIQARGIGAHQPVFAKQ